MPFIDSLDIANRACDHLGQSPIESITEDSSKNEILARVYDKLRPAELRRNVWIFSKRKVILRPISPTTMLLDPREWASSLAYPVGAIVKDVNGYLWTSRDALNQGDEPGQSESWDQYFGTLTVELYDADTTYFAGELVYAAGPNPGGFVIYRSLQNDNADDPETTTAWDISTTYETGDTVSYSGSHWRCIIPHVVGVAPADAPSAYSDTITYTNGQQVTAADGFIYTSIGSNLGVEPETNGGVNWTATGTPAAWSRIPTLFASSQKWAPILATMRPLNFLYPLGTGPRNQTNTKNIFRLPSGYLRQATINPKGYRTQNDYEIIGQFLTSSNDLVLFGYAADIVMVREFDTMFCEGLAARMALEACERITQSNGKFQMITSVYKTFMSDARAVNAIETEYEEPPEDGYLLARNDGGGPYDVWGY